MGNWKWQDYRILGKLYRLFRTERTRKSNTFKKIWAIYKGKTKIRKDSRWKIKTSTKSWKK